MICKSLFENLKYNRCLIKLDNIESNFLENKINNLINKNNLTINTISEVLEQLSIYTNVRHYSRPQIKEISNNIYLDYLNLKKKSKLSEEVGRNLHTKNNLSIDNLKIFNKNSKTSLSYSIDTNSGKFILTSKCDKINISFDTEEELNRYIQTLRVN